MVRRVLQYIAMLSCCTVVYATSLRDQSTIVMTHLKQHWKSAATSEKKKAAGAALDAFGSLRKRLKTLHELEAQNTALKKQNAQLEGQVQHLKAEVAELKQRPASAGQRRMETMRLQTQLRDMQQRESIFSQRIEELSQEVSRLRSQG